MKCCGVNGGWTKYPGNPVLGGSLGTCFDICVLNEDGNLYMYFSWRDKKSIALAKSNDGIHWGKPIIVLSPIKTMDGWEDEINRPAVIKKDGKYYMWYTGQYKPGEKDGKSFIFLATSDDGINFRRLKHDPVLSPEMKWERQAVMSPSVIWNNAKKKFIMWYSAGEQYEPNAIGYAESSDAIHWEKYIDNPVFKPDKKNEWERHKTAGCHVFYLEKYYFMFYIGYYNEDYAQIGVARSKDGITGWERSKFNPLIAPDNNKFDSEACYKPFVLYFNDRWMLWYNGRTGHKEQIGLAINDNKYFSF